MCSKVKCLKTNWMLCGSSSWTSEFSDGNNTALSISKYIVTQLGQFLSLNCQVWSQWLYQCDVAGWSSWAPVPLLPYHRSREPRLRRHLLKWISGHHKADMSAGPLKHHLTTNGKWRELRLEGYMRQTANTGTSLAEPINIIRGVSQFFSCFILLWRFSDITDMSQSKDSMA